MELQLHIDHTDHLYSPTANANTSDICETLRRGDAHGICLALVDFNVVTMTEKNGGSPTVTVSDARYLEPKGAVPSVT